MVYITGDTHGDFTRFTSSAARRLHKGDTLIVLGDFGFLWNGSKKEQRLIKKLGKLRYTVLFLDGRHENYDLLKEYPVSEWNGGKVQIIDGNLMHLMRGELYTIENESYFTFGGGESTDHDMRASTKTWWEEEMPSAEEMRAGLQTLQASGNKADYILTHEPSGKASGYTGNASGYAYNKSVRLNGVNVYLNQIEDIANYRRWFFGCLHLDKPMSKRHLAVFRHIVPVHDKESSKD